MLIRTHGLILQLSLIGCSIFIVHAEQQNPQPVQIIKKNNSFIVLQLSPAFESPVNNGLPIFFVEKNQACSVDSTCSDSTGALWSHVLIDKKKGWVSADVIRTISNVHTDSISGNILVSNTDNDKIRRSHIAFEHQEWPRRIQKAVREGSVCLEMTNDQLIASWGEPVQKSTAFLSGYGKHDVWIFKGHDEKFLLIYLVDGKIIGWSL
jgi:hypothetical protein